MSGYYAVPAWVLEFVVEHSMGNNSYYENNAFDLVLEYFQELNEQEQVAILGLLREHSDQSRNTDHECSVDEVLAHCERWEKQQ